MTTKDTLTLLREVEAALKSCRLFAACEREYDEQLVDDAKEVIQELIRRASVAPVASGWMPIEREELAQEIACYFAGFSFSRHELKECLGLVDVLIIRGLIAKPQPPQAKGAGE